MALAHGVHVSQREAKVLIQKNRRQQAQQQHPEQAEVLISILSRLDKVEKAVLKLQKQKQGMECRLTNLSDRVIRVEMRQIDQKSPEN